MFDVNVLRSDLERVLLSIDDLLDGECCLK